jgi:heme oxygenase
VILEQLKDRTRTLHDEIEQTLDLEARLQSVDSYSTLLSRLYGYYLPLELQLATIREFESIGFDFPLRRKVPWLLEDLRILGCSADDISQLPQCQRLPGTTNLAQALGCLYVIEGSTLGGQVIRREVKRRLGFTPGNGCTFFAGYQDDTAARWRDFCVSCTVYSERFPDFCEEILGTASRSFVSLKNWIAP